MTPGCNTTHRKSTSEALRVARLAEQEKADLHSHPQAPNQQEANTNPPSKVPAIPAASLTPQPGSLSQPGGRVNLSSRARHDQLSISALQQCMAASTQDRKASHRQATNLKRRLDCAEENVRELRKQLRLSQEACAETAKGLGPQARLAKVRLRFAVSEEISGRSEHWVLFSCDEFGSQSFCLFAHWTQCESPTLLLTKGSCTQCQFTDNAFQLHGCNGFLDKLHTALQQGHLQLGSHAGQVLTSIVTLSPWTAQVFDQLPLQYSALHQRPASDLATTA